MRDEAPYQKPERLKLKRKSKDPIRPEPNIPTDDQKTTVKRYFADENPKKNSETSTSSQSVNQMPSTENVEQIIVVRKPVVGSLPSFIPIG